MTRNQRKARPPRPARSQRGPVPKPYRSWLEYDFAQSLIQNGVCEKEPEYETIHVKYRVPEVTSVYIPDFPIRRKDGTILFVVEVKGRFDPDDRKKIALVKQQHPTLDVRLLFQADNKLNKSSKTRYTDWCSKRGITCAVSKNGKIPDEWLEEIEDELDAKLDALISQGWVAKENEQ